MHAIDSNSSGYATKLTLHNVIFPTYSSQKIWKLKFTPTAVIDYCAGTIDCSFCDDLPEAADFFFAVLPGIFHLDIFDFTEGICKNGSRRFSKNILTSVCFQDLPLKFQSQLSWRSHHLLAIMRQSINVNSHLRYNNCCAHLYKLFLHLLIKFNSIPDAISDISAGNFVIVVDDEDRENRRRFDYGGSIYIPLMVVENEDTHKTAFTVSVDANQGTSTGVSSSDPCKTVLALANMASTRDNFNRPGHIFPLRYTEGGVLARRSHTEASIDLCRLAGLTPVAIIAEIKNLDGTMARRDTLLAFAAKHRLKIITIEALVAYLRVTDD